MPSTLREKEPKAHEIEVGPEVLAHRAAHALIDAGAVHFDFESGFRFVSGIQAPMYVDTRMLFHKPEGREQARALLAQYAQSKKLECDVVAGTAIGGIMPGLLLAESTRLPFVYVRKSEKEHGTKKQIEGGEVEGKKTLLVEDLVNLGTSSLPAVQALRDAGAKVTDVLAITTYGFQKTKDQFQDAELTLHALTTVPTIVEVAYQRGLVTRDDADKVLAWLNEQDTNNEKISA